ncbi:hypothetical protein NIASO_09750 [Niabella soli DSM 19437]|uniref:Uncharacterized protein n=2 Tax=Niabella TaxID=379899 RepID=W0F6U7_9BACT|nr:hypothetical protein NIASO_09750 [Niabella soli DSM 19437]
MALLLMAQLANAQQFGGNPPSLHWRQIDSDTVRVIYPKGLDTTANRVAAIVSTIAGKNYHPLGSSVKKINIVLQNQPVGSNGYVGLGPFRSEFYLTPPADNFDQGTLHWADQLALHEYRHVEQYNNFNRGASRLLHEVFGQDGYSLAVNAAVPNWFFEGDAVFQETFLSAQGRGRLPSFVNSYPTLWAAGKNYKWMKLRNGSFKDYVPNHYYLGYLLVNYGYAKYGAGFWGKVTAEAAAFKGLFYPMQKAILHHTGLSYRRFIDDAFDYYKKIYGIETRPVPPAAKPTNGEEGLANYYYPQQMDDGALLYLKATVKQRPAFYIRDRMGEHLVRYRDISNETQFSYSNGKIVYAALEADPRWSWKTYSSLRLIDLRSGTQRKVTTRTRYFSPDISVDGKLLAANSVDLKGHSSLVLLDAATGNILDKFAMAGIDYFANPKIKSRYEVIAAVRQQNGDSYIGLIHFRTKKITPLTPPTHRPVGQISLFDHKVYFIGSMGLQDAIFSVDLQSHQIKKLENKELGAYFINASRERLHWSSFTDEGYRLRQQNENDSRWTNQDPNAFVQAASGFVSDSLPHAESPLNIAVAPRPSKKYAQLTRPVNLHSWRPNYIDPEYSFTVYGNNILNTTQTNLYYIYNQNDKSSTVGGSITYGGLYPYIGIGSQYSFNREVMISQRLRRWNQWDNYLSFSVPLSWIDGRLYKYLNAGTNLGYQHDFDQITTQPGIHFGYLTHSLGFGAQVQQSRMDIFPKWGLGIKGQYRYALNQWISRQLLAKATGYLPGLLPTHSFVLSVTEQESSAKYQLFSNQLNFARGFNAVSAVRAGTATFNYHLPLLYPDWGFGNILYLQRVRGAAFFDYSVIKENRSAPYKNLQSAGAEIYVDTQWWNQYPLTFGFRIGERLTQDLVVPDGPRLFYEFILPVSLIPK